MAPKRRAPGELPSAADQARAYGLLDEVRQRLQSDGTLTAIRARAALSPEERGIYVGLGAPIQIARANAAAKPHTKPPRNQRSKPVPKGGSKPPAQRATANPPSPKVDERAELEQLRREQLAGLSERERAQAAKITDPAHRSRFVALCRRMAERRSAQRHIGKPPPVIASAAPGRAR